MNILKREKRDAVLAALVEGVSVRSIERLTGVHRDTILRLMVRVGLGCEKLLDRAMRGLRCRKIQVDEIWTFVSKKQRRLEKGDDESRMGDFWCFVAVDADSKLVPTWRVGKRTLEMAKAFLEDLAGRLLNRVQLSSDALPAYVEAAEAGFGGQVDYGQIVKSYESEPIGPGRYSPPRVSKVEKEVIVGKPDPKHISTSYVERQNLTMRMAMRRFTRLTNAFSKKPENLEAAVALHFAHYNLCRIHRSLRSTPAMRAGVTNHLWGLPELADAALAIA